MNRLRSPLLLLSWMLVFTPRGTAQIIGSPGVDEQFGHAVATGDFNGDGFDDLAIGVPGEDFGATNAGAVSVIYGTSAGLSDVGDQLWIENQCTAGACEEEDQFGSALAAGDFDGDGFDDLAIGVPFEDVGATEDAGNVHVLYGGTGGLTPTGNQVWSQDTADIEGTSEERDQFGGSLAAGDFDGDGFSDLAIGVHFETVDDPNDGAVNVIYGTATGLNATGDQLWHQDISGIEGETEENDFFGGSLATGDFDGDGRDDLAIGVPGEEINGETGAGAVNVIYGSSAGLSAAGDQIWHQDSPDIEGTSELGDTFGSALASGSFDGDGRDDLAIGVVEDIGTISRAGAVNVMYGSADGLSATGNQLWDQNSAGIADDGENSDLFGSGLAAGDLNGDGRDDLAIGVFREDIGAISDAGAVNVIYGTNVGLSFTGDQFWHQDSPGIAGAAEAFDRFGFALATGNFDGDGVSDLAIGIPGEDIDATGGAGAAGVLYGTTDGLGEAGSQLWYQGATPTATEPNAPDRAHDVVLAPAYPNPFVNRTTLTFTLTRSGPVSVAVYDALGRRVAVVADGLRAAGRHEIVLEADNLPAGTYVVWLKTTSAAHTVSLVRLP